MLLKNTDTTDKYFISAFYVIIIFTFILFDYLRSYIFKTEYIYINFVAIFFTLLLLMNRLYKKQYNEKILYAFIMCAFFAIISAYSATYSKGNYMLIMGCYIMPLLLIGMNCNDLTIESIYLRFLKLLNFIVYVILLLGIIDYISKGNVQQFLINKQYFTGRMIELVYYNLEGGVYRYYSFWGHPLRNAEIFLIYFVINNIFNKYYYVKENPIKISIITLIGVTIANSKIGFLLALILIIFLNSNSNNRDKTKHIYGGIILLIIVLFMNSGIFNSTIVQRIAGDSDLSSGRNQIVSAIIDGYVDRPQLLGGGLDYSYYIRNLTGYGATSFEYPPIMFAYDLGVVTTVLMYILIAIYPMITFFKHKNYYILFSFIIILLDVTSYNGLTNRGDFMFQYCLIIFLLLNIDRAVFTNVRYQSIHISENMDTNVL
ncbi:hypothetical protein [Clostridium fungisolvens]|uniref:Uncharacterized protein n=1 Tax=Clostridium fungisolvens TaxID=1604897 RepID=A0A6V8SH01_9CLOT|nr:hypothetical protein [Clostridium fungisolvens]GFP74153.1 hypothetical protein bsdtw1_00198 [Clostridium fungisolvens]